MSTDAVLSPKTMPRDLLSGIVVFLVALPLCLGIALASGAPLFSGLIAGIVGGIVVGSLSGSHTSVSGPAAGLTAIVIVQIETLGFETFLLAVFIAGVFQIGLGLAKAGVIAEFFPTSVIKGLLAAIGVILILKQIPHVFGHDTDPEGDMAFQQPDNENTFSELGEMLSHIHPAATVIGLVSVVLLIVWDRYKPLKKTGIPAPLLVVLLGVVGSQLLARLGGRWIIESSHMVQVPVADSIREFTGFLQLPAFSAWSDTSVWVGAVTICLVASLESMLNLEAADRLDPKQRHSPPSRELVAQGAGNLACGMLGGIPVTTVIIRSTVNINAGAQTKLSAIFHGLLLLFCVMLLPQYLNMIPLSCLAAILLVTGFKLASPKVVKQMWSKGRYQFIPFIVTVVAIVLTDLLLGIVIGMIVSLSFILNSNIRRPIRRIMEKHLGDSVLRIELAEQVSFMKKAALSKALYSVPKGGHVLIDASTTDYIDPDVLDLIRDFKEKIGPAHGVAVSLKGFRDKYDIDDHIQYVDYATRDLQSAISPEQVLQVLREGHRRFRTGERLNRDLSRQVYATADKDHPLAVVLSCIDSRAPAELIFDCGVGDIYSVRIAGNITSRKVLGSIEYGCQVAGAKLILVLGHTRCGAVTEAVERLSKLDVNENGCQYIDPILQEINAAIDGEKVDRHHETSENEREAFVNHVARENVARIVGLIPEQSETIAKLVREGKVAIVGAMYDVTTGDLEFFDGDLPDSEKIIENAAT